MSAVDELLPMAPFSLSKDEKSELYAKSLFELTKNSYENCDCYKRILQILRFYPDVSHKKEDYPFLPVRLFKDFNLLNVPQGEIVKMTKHISTIIAVLIFITGLSLLLYPTVSECWNSLYQSKVVANYSDKMK